MSMIFNETDEEILESGFHARKELDKVFHVIPRWVHRMFPKASLSEKISLGFQHQQDEWHKEIKKHADTRDELMGFATWLVEKNGMDFGEAYWNYLKFRQSRKDTASKKTS